MNEYINKPKSFNELYDDYAIACKLIDDYIKDNSINIAPTVPNITNKPLL